jgi:hypothetical protein
MSSNYVLPVGEYPTTDSLLQQSNYQAGGRLTLTFYSSSLTDQLHLPTCPAYNITTRTVQKTPLIVVVQSFPWECLLTKPLLSNDSCIFAYVAVVAQQRSHVLQREKLRVKVRQWELGNKFVMPHQQPSPKYYE